MPYNIFAAVYAIGSIMTAQASGNLISEDTNANTNACTLLSLSEISEVIGLPVEDGVRKDSGYVSNGSYSSTCVWKIEREGSAATDPTAPLGGRSFVILNVMRWPEGSGLARTFLEAFHEAAANGEIPNKPDARPFGDEALWWGDGLAVRNGDVSFGVSVFIPGLNARYPGGFEEQLTPHILRRLDESVQRQEHCTDC